MISSLRSSDRFDHNVGVGITGACFALARVVFFAREEDFALLLERRRELVLFLRVDERGVFRFWAMS